MRMSETQSARLGTRYLTTDAVMTTRTESPSLKTLSW